MMRVSAFSFIYFLDTAIFYWYYVLLKTIKMVVPATRENNLIGILRKSGISCDYFQVIFFSLFWVLCQVQEDYTTGLNHAGKKTF